MNNNKTFDDFTCDLQAAKLLTEEWEGYIMIVECAIVLPSVSHPEMMVSQGISLLLLWFSELQISK